MGFREINNNLENGAKQALSLQPITLEQGRRPLTHSEVFA
jgi:hypothetical protein